MYLNTLFKCIVYLNSVLFFRQLCLSSIQPVMTISAILINTMIIHDDPLLNKYYNTLHDKNTLYSIAVQEI